MHLKIQKIRSRTRLTNYYCDYRIKRNRGEHNLMRKLGHKTSEKEKHPFVVSKKPVLAGGMLSKYADKTKWKKEKKAFEKGIIMEQVIKNKELDTTNDYIDIKMTEADNSIKNGDKFYTREGVDKILSMIVKE